MIKVLEPIVSKKSDGKGGELSVENVILPKTVGEFEVTKELPDNVVEDRMRRTGRLFASAKNCCIIMSLMPGFQ